MADLIKVKEISILINKEALESAFRMALLKHRADLGLDICDSCGCGNSADEFKIAEILTKEAIKHFKEAEVLK